MNKCEYCHEGMCALECIENKIYKKHPCKFAKGKILKQCTAKREDLVEVDE